eukprot:CAMPEP_0181318188 /NCGR_PEP_ID=MMETSP1101-20121128/16875_1 /TAXON_ID=46948 /ORGANISM="Rhodomonas abbreviata, Strain Caron Lab Isolate" /LENGTH=62 /DNA_ID=CAMNT_0023425645 /DNA_START=379 /DNA_END=564 /DNA_ORIENTATION=+
MEGCSGNWTRARQGAANGWKAAAVNKRSQRAVPKRRLHSEVAERGDSNGQVGCSEGRGCKVE